ncbi:MAG TPA: hypothetical protein VMK31_04070 [Sphingomicrobium sp.]|nr:hypothetical protein [Sphingomicrobium sp.]
MARSETAARLLGVASTDRPAQASSEQVARQGVAQSEPQKALNPAIAKQIEELQERIRRIETEEAEGPSGRADALLIALATRRAIERGVALGYLERLLVDRFGSSHPQAVATIITASRSPVRLTELIARHQDLRPELVGRPPDEDLWTGIKRGFSSLVSIRRSDRPGTEPQARYERALSHLMAGEVDSALAETMRLPGAPRAREWIADARRYVAARRAVDAIESAALLGSSPSG